MSEDPEQIAHDLAEELRRLRVEDVIIGALVQMSTIGYHTLGLTEDTRGARNLEQTRLAIDAMNALVPVLEHVVPADLVREFQSSVASLQLAYVKAAGEETAKAEEDDE